MANINQSSLDSYNPFDAEPPKYEVSAAPVAFSNNQSPAKLPVDTGGIQIGGEHFEPFQTPTSVDLSRPRELAGSDAILALERRQAELEARAAELDRREKEQEARMNAAYKAGAAPHNWPPFPSFCPCKPCVRQDFESDIPPDCRMLAKMGYYLWLTYTLILVCNLCSTLSYFIVTDSAAGGPLFGTSILFVLIMPPASFFAWHRPLYKALRSESSFNYILFFIMFAIQIIILSIQCLGLDYFGSSGWLNGLKTCSKSKSVCTFMLIVAFFETVADLWAVFILFKVHRRYRSSEASINKAKLELASVAAHEAGTSFGAVP